MKKNTKIASRFSVAAAVAAVVLSPVVASAATANTTINVTLAPVISMTTGSPVAISVTPTSGGSMSSISDTVTVTTTDSAGYTLTLADTDASTVLTSGANTITADAGTQAAPSTSLTNNRWGYRVDGVGGFGAGPTSAETNIASSAYKWAGVPVSGSPNTLKITAVAATSGDPTTVWYGVKADTTKPSSSGTPYSDIVTYTATAN